MIIETAYFSGIAEVYIKMNNSLTESKLLAYDLSEKGIPQTEIGKVIGKSDRTVRNYIHDVKSYLYNSKEWSMALEDLKKTIPDAVKVIRKYLKGKGAKPGGDLETAKWVLEGIGLVCTTKNTEVSIENNSVTALNCDIKVDPQPDPEFAREAVNQIERMLNYKDNE